MKSNLKTVKNLEGFVAAYANPRVEKSQVKNLEFQN